MADNRAGNRSHNAKSTLAVMTNFENTSKAAQQLQLDEGTPEETFGGQGENLQELEQPDMDDDQQEEEK